MAGKRVSAAGIVVRVLVVIALAIAIYYVWQWRTAGPVAKMEEIKLGDSRERVIEVLGTGAIETDALPLSVQKDLPDNVEKADAEIWLIYEGGMGVKCVVGLDSGGQVVYKGHTGT